MKFLTRTVSLFMLAFALGKETCAQRQFIRLPVCGDDPSVIKQQLKSTSFPQFVTRAAAVGGETLVPTLRELSKPGEPFFTVGGAVQVSLARLGDAQSLEEIKQEFQVSAKTHKPEIFETIAKLGAVRNETSVTTLIGYLIQNRDNPKRKFDYGDTGDDPLARAIEQLTSMLEDPPFKGAYPPSPNYELQLDEWQSWWQSTKPPHVTSIYMEVSDTKARCLARLAEWGDADSVFELYQYSGKSILPVLERFARLGDKTWETSPTKTVRGNAQTILAKEGDRTQLEKIIRELDDLSYADGISKLQFIGGYQSFEALLSALSLRTFMRSERWRHYDRAYMKDDERKLQTSLMAVLSSMVKNPPLPADAESTPENIRTWNEWWEKNKPAPQFMQSPN